MFRGPKIGGGVPTSLPCTPYTPCTKVDTLPYICHIYIYILYSTPLSPLPLNLANKQQATSNKQQATSNQQATHKQASTSPSLVLASAPPHCSGLYSTLAILEPRWCPCRIQILSQKLTSGTRGGCAKSGCALPKPRILCPKTALRLNFVVRHVLLPPRDGALIKPTAPLDTDDEEAA